MKINGTLYFDYQASTPLDPRVFAHMKPHYEGLCGNPHSSDHVLGWRAKEAIDSAAKHVAALIGADPDEIVFTSGATEANNLALLGLAHRALQGNRRRILAGATEHKCVLAALRALEERNGFVIELIPVDRCGFINLNWLEGRLGDDVLCVSVMAVNNEIGTIQDLAAIAAMIEKYDILFHSDCAQASVACDLSHVSDIVDMVSLSAHKMYGPQGIGALYVRRELHDSLVPLIYGGGQQGNLRSGTLPTALCVGMGVAAKLAREEAATERQTTSRQRDAFVACLQNLSWPIDINGPMPSQRHPGNANLRFEGFDAHDILLALQPKLAASTGSACTSGTPEPSYVLRAVGLSETEARSSIRFSIGRFIEDAEIQEAAILLEEVLSDLSTTKLSATA
jgi:cysteine desulfurase